MNSIRARVDHVRTWLEMRLPDILLMQELKGSEFPASLFAYAGYQSAFVTQKTYNGVAILSRSAIDVTCTTLLGDEADSHARFLEARIDGLRIVNIYAPNEQPALFGKVRVQAGMDGPIGGPDEALARRWGADPRRRRL